MSLVTVVRERPCKLALLSVVVLRFSILFDKASRFVSKSTFTPEEIAASPHLEPALESLPRSMKVNDSVITSMRVNEISDRAVFADLAQDEETMRKCAAAVGIGQSDQADFPLQREMAKLLRAWELGVRPGPSARSSSLWMRLPKLLGSRSRCWQWIGTA